MSSRNSIGRAPSLGPSPPEAGQREGGGDISDIFGQVDGRILKSRWRQQEICALCKYPNLSGRMAVLKARQC
jgi:hypothetical protein